MPSGMYFRNKVKNRNLAILFLAIIFVQEVGIVGLLGYNLTSYQLFAGISAWWIFITVTLIWVMYGLWKHEVA